MTEVILPYRFEYMAHQKNLARYIQEGGRRAVAVWHRRAGKDLSLFNMVIGQAVEVPGLYYYLFPTYTQAKKVIWEGMTNDGRKFLDYIPKELIQSMNGTELTITLKTGSIIRLIGTDKYDSIRGTNPIGCVFSEFAFQNRMAWEVIRPILARNGGWAVFNSTPNGKNHFYKLYQMALSNDNWFAELLSVDDTKLLSEEDIERERAEGMMEKMIQQEYYCSFDIGAIGAYYIDQINKARAEGRIDDCKYNPDYPVMSFLDIGKSDSTAIIYTQMYDKKIYIIDAYSSHGKEVGDYVREIKSKKYKVEEVHLPHDAFANRLESRHTIAEQFQEMGLRVRRVERSSIDNGIQQARKIFPLIHFNKNKSQELIEAIEHYHAKYDPVKHLFSSKPDHDWSSHFADAFRYMANTLSPLQEITTKGKDAYIAHTSFRNKDKRDEKFGLLESKHTSALDRYMNK